MTTNTMDVTTMATTSVMMTSKNDDASERLIE